MTLNIMGTDNSRGDSKDTNVDTIELIQASMNPQVFTFPANQVTSVTFALDGSAAAFQEWSSGGNNGDYIFDLQNSASTADCSSLSGV
jgi:hypothetical protein